MEQFIRKDSMDISRAPRILSQSTPYTPSNYSVPSSACSTPPPLELLINSESERVQTDSTNMENVPMNSPVSPINSNQNNILPPPNPTRTIRTQRAHLPLTLSIPQPPQPVPTPPPAYFGVGSYNKDGPYIMSDTDVEDLKHRGQERKMGMLDRIRTSDHVRMIFIIVIGLLIFGGVAGGFITFLAMKKS